ncbi:RAD protein [Plasmodium cynomolgi strain B]|uniref:RAD protein n=1 Tax=Plasmodium cynomolgi (strain B) TaxID=1120755 RepID=K6UCP5_PLACD|nr:RAD protein [Plasmodium cynomolgi strain B]GAB65211.1 RAD protein [Plasmodium cynomolgi strain B]
MVYSKERRSWVHVLYVVPLFLICTVSLSPNEAMQVGTLAGTYPFRCARSLSEMSLLLNDSIFGDNEQTNENNYTSGNGHIVMNQEGPADGEMNTKDNWAELKNLTWLELQNGNGLGEKHHGGDDQQQRSWANEQQRSWANEQQRSWVNEQQRNSANEQESNSANEQQINWMDLIHLKWDDEGHRKLEDEKSNGRSQKRRLDLSDGDEFDGSDRDEFDLYDGDEFDGSDRDELDGSDRDELAWSDEEKDKKPYPRQRYGAYPQQSYGAYPKQSYGAYPQQSYGGSPQQSYGAPPQQRREAYPRRYGWADYPNWKNRVLERYKRRLPYGCNIYDISKELTDEQILNMQEDLFFRISKRKAFIFYFYYGIYLERKYYNMVNYLSKWFADAAKANNLSDAYKLECWEECIVQLMYDLEYIQMTCEKLFSNFVSKRRKKNMWTVSFENLLYRFRKIACTSIAFNKDKWSSILTHRLNSYLANENREDSTQRR